MKKATLITFLVILTLPVLAQWNDSSNIVVMNDFRLVSAVPDGANGSIIITSDGDGIYAQKITGSGILAWRSADSPVVVSPASYTSYTIYAIADGSGGAYVGWADTRHNANVNDDYTEIYLQHISNAGAILWIADGTRVTNTSNTYNDELQLCSDGVGGVIVSWYAENEAAKTLQSFAQRYNSSGNAQWAANGVQVCTAPGFRGLNAMASDGSGGAIIFFLDTRNDVNGLNYDSLDNNYTTNYDIYAQRLNGSGARLWGNNGLAVCTAPGTQYPGGRAIPDGTGGAILYWDDLRNDNGTFDNVDVFAQRVNSAGIVQWLANGVAVLTGPDYQSGYDLVTDGSGGAVIAVKEYEESEYRFQRITSAGSIAWAGNGVAIEANSFDDDYLSIVSDGTGNTIVSYDRQVDTLFPYSFMAAQKINALGALQWGSEGIQISNSIQPDESKIVLSNNGSAIISWRGYTSYSYPFERNVFAAKVLSSGEMAGAVSPAGYISVANGNWNAGSTWVGGVVPPAAANVTIRHNVTGNINTTCTSLRVEYPGQLNVNTGINITILK